MAYDYRMVTFSNNVEPANGFLLRYLHRKAVEAHQEKEPDSAQQQALLCVLDWVPQLWYHLHTFLEKHSTSDFLIGERQWMHGWGMGTQSGKIVNMTFCLPQVPASSCHAQYQW